MASALYCLCILYLESGNSKPVKSALSALMENGWCLTDILQAGWYFVTIDSSSPETRMGINGHYCRIGLSRQKENGDSPCCEGHSQK
jgi:hypothetical protein